MTGSKVVFIISAFTIFAVNAKQISADVAEDIAVESNQTTYQQENIFQIVDDNYISKISLFWF